MGFLTPNATGERDLLKTYALQQLAQMRTTVHGLSDDDAHSTPTASGLNLSGLVLHAGEVAVYWSACAAGAPGGPSMPEELPEEHSIEELVADRRSVAEVVAFLDRCARVTADNIDAVTDLEAPVPVPEAPWFPADLTHWEARWCLLHISTEIARHVGHADIIRETLDGKGSYELNDLEDASIGA